MRDTENKLLEGLKQVYDEEMTSAGAYITAETVWLEGGSRRVFALNCKGVKARPLIDVDGTVKAVEAGELSLEDGTYRLCEMMIQAMNTTAEYCKGLMDDVVTQENLDTGKILLLLVGRAGNEDILEKVPHTEFLDLACMYRLRAQDGRSAVITNEHVEKYGLSLAWLHLRAREDSREFLTIKSIESMINGLAKQHGIPGEAEQGQDEHIPMYVLGNHKPEGEDWGACAMLYTDMMDAVCVLCKSEEVYILPSSVGEIIAIPKGENDTPEDREGLKYMIQDINRSILDDDEKLSDSLYSYSMKDAHYSVW